MQASYLVGTVGGEAVSKPVDVLIEVTDGLGVPLGSDDPTIETLDSTTKFDREIPLSASCPDQGCHAEVTLIPTFNDPVTGNNMARSPLPEG